MFSCVCVCMYMDPKVHTYNLCSECIVFEPLSEEKGISIWNVETTSFLGIHGMLRLAVLENRTQGAVLRIATSGVKHFKNNLDPYS